MEMKLTTCLAIISALLMHQLQLTVTLIAGHKPLDKSSSDGFSIPMVNNHTFYHGNDGFLHLKHSLRTDSLLPIHEPQAWLVDVGTGNGQQRYMLKVDTSSILTWIQCKPCTPHSRQLHPIFDPAKSPTYRHVPGTFPQCKWPYKPVLSGTLCSFNITCARARLVQGYLSQDHFVLYQHDYPDFIFGCAHSAENFQSDDTYAGVASLGQAPTSLVMQVAARGLTHFSYCLFGGTELSNNGFLRFGTDVPRNRHYRTAKILPALHAQESEYYVSLVGLSLGAQRLDKIRPEMFARHKNGQGGCVIDLGTPLTVMVEEAYHVLEEVVWSNLHRHRAERVKQSNFGLCVRATKVIKGHLQSLSLHFLEEDAVLVISPAQLFLMMNDKHGQMACLAMIPGPRTIIGAFQQVDTRFIYDLKESKLSFASESCSRDTTPIV